MLPFPKMTGSTMNAAAIVFLALCLLLTSRPAVAGPDDTERDMRGFDSTIVRREKARRAMVKGKTYLDDGVLEQARKSLSEALALNDDLHEARFYLGQAEYKDGKYRLAVAQFENLYERYPDFRNLRLELARSYLALGECGTAGKWLELHLRDSQETKETKKLKSDIDKCANMREKKI